MDDRKRLRKKYWTFVAVWVALIYSSLYVVRPICTFLKGHTPFPLLVNSFIVILFVWLVAGAWARGAITFPSTYTLLASGIAAYGYGLSIIAYPEEKIHFIEYGYLAYLVFMAVRVDACLPVAYSCAFVLTALFGWIDEGIQFLLPNRYYQVDDVILNAVSGLLGLFMVFVMNRERRIRGLG